MQINEKTGLYNNYGVWHTPFWQTEAFLRWMKIAVVCIVSFFVCAICYIVYVRYKDRKLRTPWARAIACLEQLKARGILINPERGKEFYHDMSGILKTYLHERFNYDVLGKTDAEVVSFLEEHHADLAVIADIKELLHGSVFVKFANAQAVQERMQQDYNRIESIIRSTIPEKK